MNGIVSPRQVIAYIGNLGSSLPTAIAQHRGNLFWKRASGAEDELYAGVRDSSGVNQLRRILTKTYGDTLYDAVGHAHTEYFVPAPAAPIGMTVAPATSTTLTSNSSYAIYLGRAGAAYTSIDSRWDVTTQAQTITWAEVGIGTAPVITLHGAASITRRGFTDVSASFNSTGEKTVTTTVSGIAAGDHLWALCGSQAVTPFQILASVGGNLSAGNHQVIAATRISTMASPTVFGELSNPAATAIATMWIGT
jgi:hypothetical protein